MSTIHDNCEDLWQICAQSVKTQNAYLPGLPSLSLHRTYFFPNKDLLEKKLSKGMVRRKSGVCIAFFTCCVKFVVTALLNTEIYLSQFVTGLPRNSVKDATMDQEMITRWTHMNSQRLGDSLTCRTTTCPSGPSGSASSAKTGPLNFEAPGTTAEIVRPISNTYATGPLLRERND